MQHARRTVGNFSRSLGLLKYEIKPFSTARNVLKSGRLLAAEKTGPAISFRKHIHSTSSCCQQIDLQNKEERGSIAARLCPNAEFLIVTLADGSTLDFPAVWLRDNCLCDKCFNPVMNSRTINWQTFDVDVKPVEVSVDGDSVDVLWSDGHASRYAADWLANRSFAPTAQQDWLEDTYRPRKVPWGAKEFPGILARFKFNDVINSDDCLLAWLDQMAHHGVAIVEDTPARADQVRRLADRVAFIKKTHYGEEFEVKAKSDTSNLAYLAIPLQLHTDLPYYEYKPGFNMLHCLVQTRGQGGDNQLTDCVRVSDILKADHPDAYRTLTTTMVEWNDIGQDLEGRFYSIFRAPVLCLDRNGRFDRINYSQQQRDSHFKVPLDRVAPWYRAHKTLTDLLHHPDNTVFFKTKPGEILVFDNVRMVHGRTGYDDVPGNERHLVGVYLDWDIVYSKLRILKREKYPEQYV